MDDLEFTGTVPLGDEPTKEPEQTQPIPQQPAAPQEPGFYAWTGAAQPQQKESPFANSPYTPPVAPEAPQDPAAPRQDSPFANSPYARVVQPEQPKTTPPVPPRPQPAEQPPRKRSVLPLLSLLACIGILVLLLTTFLITNGRITSMKSDFQARLDAYARHIEQLEKQLAPGQSGTNPQLKPATNDVPVRVPSAQGYMTPAQVYANCVNSVVAIDCISTGRNNFGQYVEVPSSGSGFILSEDGYIVTNYHVVENCSSIEISMYDGTTYAAEYIGGNEANDIALIKVDGKNLPPVTIGSSSDLIVGDQVVAIGNPLGELASTLTVGYVSAKDRIVTSEGTQINMLQTDAAINPGNSGGPLFNMYGEVVGITSAKYSGTTTSGATIEGIGFAIPTDDVIMMLEDLRTFGHVTGGYLGVTVTEVDQETTELYGLPQGVLIRDVMPGSCAEKAGMRSRDIIIDIAGNEVKNLNSLSRALNKCKAGQEVTVTVYRSGSEVELTVILDERPQEEKPQVTTEPATEPYNPWPGDSFMDDWFGQFFG